MHTMMGGMYGVKGWSSRWRVAQTRESRGVLPCYRQHEYIPIMLIGPPRGANAHTNLGVPHAIPIDCQKSNPQ